MTDSPAWRVSHAGRRFVERSSPDGRTDGCGSRVPSEQCMLRASNIMDDHTRAPMQRSKLRYCCPWDTHNRKVLLCSVRPGVYRESFVDIGSLSSVIGWARRLGVRCAVNELPVCLVEAIFLLGAVRLPADGRRVRDVVTWEWDITYTKTDTTRFGDTGECEVYLNTVFTSIRETYDLFRSARDVRRVDLCTEEGRRDMDISIDWSRHTLRSFSTCAVVQPPHYCRWLCFD